MNWALLSYGLGALLALLAVLTILRVMAAKPTAAAIATLPTTQVGFVVTYALLILVVLAWVIKCVFLSGPEPAAFDTVCWLLAGFGGVSLAQFGWKRQTYQPSPPAAVDVEDAKAGVSTTAAPSGVARGDRAANGLGTHGPATVERDA